MSRLQPALPEPEPAARQHSEQVSRAVSQAIAAAGGWLRFDHYMELVLYAPGLGYYAAGARKFGDFSSGGDFVTAPEISPLFAQALAAQIAALFTQVPARIVEFGAGSGVLARDLLAALRRHGIDAEYSIVELSPDLIERQQQRLRGCQVSWHAEPPPAFEGVMLANEVLDVMPVRLFVKKDGRSFERGVVEAGGKFAFRERPAASDLVTAVRAIETELGELPDGFASEIGFIAAGWLHSAADWLARGALIAIDYGFPRHEYYHPQRAMGTIMCHYRHRAHADPFWLPGLTDVTAHVDFSAAADAAHAAGLDVLGYTTQAHFLINCGILDLLAPEPDPVLAGAAHRLLSEAEMGELFKVLVVGRGIEGPLLGFSRGDRRHTL
jgi:SAM-dependent MidA family methyltransferase